MNLFSFGNLETHLTDFFKLIMHTYHFKSKMLFSAKKPQLRQDLSCPTYSY